ncbi:hypothetical protein AX16_005155 [Volvariella volvacea WC 439]|nr:hypothetical protein AX16_005155 [Volvariella volvacea WC 439]
MPPNTYSFGEVFSCRILFCYKHSSGLPYQPFNVPYSIKDYASHFLTYRTTHFEEAAVDIRCHCRHTVNNGINGSITPVYGTRPNERFHHIVANFQNFDVVISPSQPNNPNSSCIFSDPDQLIHLFRTIVRPDLGFTRMLTTLKFTIAGDEMQPPGHPPIPARQLPPALNNRLLRQFWMHLTALSNIRTLITGMSQLEYLDESDSGIYGSLQTLDLTIRHPYQPKMIIVRFLTQLASLRKLSLDVPHIGSAESYVQLDRLLVNLRSFELWGLPPSPPRGQAPSPDLRFWLAFMRNLLASGAGLTSLVIPLDLLENADDGLLAQLAHTIKLTGRNPMSMTVHGSLASCHVQPISKFAQALEQIVLNHQQRPPLRTLHWSIRPPTSMSREIVGAVKNLKKAVERFAVFYTPQPDLYR